MLKVNMNKSLKFNLVMLPFQPIRSEGLAYYTPVTKCWQQVWKDLYQKMDIPKSLPLDQLLRHDEGACIFLESQCIGMILFRTLDFKILNFADDSYFKEWRSEDIAKLLQHGSRAFLATYLTVHPEFRNFSPEVKFKEILLDLMVKRFKDSNADVISGITRRDRGIHDESYKLGATLIRQNVEYMDGRFRVDLVAFYRDQACESSNLKVRQISDQLWSDRLDITRMPLDTPSMPKKIA